MKKALEGLRRYQQAIRPPPPGPMPIVAEAEGAMLRDYGGEGPPALFVPSLINPPTVLDLGQRSLLRWLAASGRRSLLLDWGWPDESRADWTVADHVERILLPLLDRLGEPAHLVGYCLGGTIAVAAARHRPARSLVTLAAPWHFSGYSPEAREAISRLWSAGGSEAVRRIGMLPMEVLQSAFWSLDPARTVAKFEAFADMPEGSTEAGAFVMLEDWANDGPPLPGGAARDLFTLFFAADAPGLGDWQVASRHIREEELQLPVLNVVSTTDRIVPAATALRAGRRVELDQGHVGMVVSSQAPKRLWPILADWLAAH